MSTQRSLLLSWLAISSLTLSTGIVTVRAELSDEVEQELKEDGRMATRWTTANWRSFMVELGHLSTEEGSNERIWSHRCAASLIRDTFPAALITSAHCVYYKSIGYRWDRHNNYYAVFHKPNENWTAAILARISRIDYVGAYDRKPDAVMGDVAIVFLDLDLTKTAQTIHIPTPVQFELYMKDIKTDAKIVGWYKKENGGIQLGDTNVRVLKLETCRRVFGVTFYDLWYGHSDDELKDPKTGLAKLMSRWRESGEPTVYEVYNDEFCVWDLLEKSSSNCNGDSGAPMISLKADRITQRAGSAMLLGVTSGGLVGGCQPHLPVVYSNIDFYRNWIDARMKCSLKQIHNNLSKANLGNLARKMKNGFFKTMTDLSNDGERQRNLQYYTELRTSDKYLNWMKTFMNDEEINGYTCESLKREEEKIKNVKMIKTHDICHAVGGVCQRPRVAKMRWNANLRRIYRVYDRSTNRFYYNIDYRKHLEQLNQSEDMVDHGVVFRTFIGPPEKNSDKVSEIYLWANSKTGDFGFDKRNAVSSSIKSWSRVYSVGYCFDRWFKGQSEPLKERYNKNLKRHFYGKLREGIQDRNGYVLKGNLCFVPIQKVVQIDF